MELTYADAELATPPGEDGPLTFTASSTRLNRHGFQLRTDGWVLDNYQANPVVLWMHDPYSPPIGRAAALNKGDRIAAEVTFDGTDEFAQRIESKYRRGFLSAVSVGLGFVDESGARLDVWRLSDEDIRDKALYDLREISAVTVPADPAAVIQNRLSAVLGRRMAGLFGEQEHGSALAAEVRAAVRAELEHLGLDLKAHTQDEALPGIDNDAAQAVLAAFTLEGTS